ncbi:MAG: calcium-translocating P-type ATPase, PMCA-type [Bacilli bacterium]|nr:calcium-translocating P-type ATPase, PMCA-type [Bacilli bacterium]
MSNYIGNGLSDEEVVKSRKKHGSNSISIVKQNKFINFLLDALADPIIKILLIALAIKVIFLFKDFDFFETLGIVIAIFVATFISSLSEYGSEKAFNKMQEDASKIKCKVKRNGKIFEVNIDDVVVNDLVILESGDKIPADGYLIDGEVSIDESSLTGESKEVYKYKVNGNVTDKNRVFRGTVVYSNKGIMKVDKVGLDTMYGSITKELTDKAPDSPLKIKLSHLAKIISKIGYICAFVCAFSYLFSEFIIDNNFNIELIKKSITDIPLVLDKLLYALTLCVTIIVVAVPEGLPMMITLVLSSNMKKMLKDNVLVRKLVGIETSGSLNILFTDKTGTLTKGKLEVNSFILGNLKEFNEEFELNNYKKYHDIFKMSIIVNNASNYDYDKKCVFAGNITDRALLDFSIEKTYSIRKLNTIEFDSKNKYAVTTVDKNGKLNLVKGAPEKLIDYCKFYYDEYGEKKELKNNDKLKQKIDFMTNKGIRAIAFIINTNVDPNNFKNSTLVSVIFLKDEIRKEAIEGIKLTKSAGIQTIMITGDNRKTAINIAKEIGLIDNENDIAIDSEDLNKLTDDEIKEILPRLKVVARSLPTDKSKLVRISQKMGLVTGMTGDGVNDAPALKKADVGFAMGSGTEVAKEASDIVILDDNYLSISKAILYGRTIFKSIRKFMIVQLTINLCAITLSIICPFIGVDTPVTVIQMLWVNMIMDTLAGLAFAFEPPLLSYMKEKPKKRNESIINKYMFSEIIFTGLYSAIICLIFLKSDFIANLFRSSSNNAYLMSAFFGLFIFIDIFNSFSARTSRINILSNIKQNKTFIGIMLFITVVQILLIYFGGDMFRTTSLTLKEFIIMLLFAFTVVPVDLFRKLIYRKMYNEEGV